MARAENSALVAIQMPASYSQQPIEFMAEVEGLSLEADRVAKVVINERTGTIVMGKEVRITPIAVFHGNLSVEIQTTLVVSQPAPLSAGQTTVVPQVAVNSHCQCSAVLMAQPTRNRRYVHASLDAPSRK